MKIFIDAGHNYSGADTGAFGNGIREQDITFIIGKKLRDLLKSNGHEVKMSRNALTDNIGTTVNDSLKKRVQMSNDWGAELFISIHANAGGGSGTEIYVYSENSSALSVAESVQSAVVKRLDMADRGVKYSSGLYVLSKTKAPAILIETAFIDNKEDADKLSHNPEKFAIAICEGIVGNKIKELDKGKDTVMPEKNFVDTKGHFAEKDINDLYEMGIINGKTKDKFMPNESITRGEVAVIVRRLIRYITGK